MRVVWAVSLLNSKWTELQWRLMVTSVRSWKQFHPKTTTVLYGSYGVLNMLRRLNCLELWDEVHEDQDSYLSGCFTNASWDYPKVEALSKEKGKVLFIDYDIFFTGKILNKLDKNYNWFWSLESTNVPWYFRSHESIVGLPPELRSKIYHGPTAYNTGMLYVDPKYLLSWKECYRAIFPSANTYVSTEEATKFSLTIGQGNIVSIVPKDTVKFISDVCKDEAIHFVGEGKAHVNSPQYPEYKHILDTLYPDPEFEKNYKKLRVI